MGNEFRRELGININTSVNTKKIQEAEKVIGNFIDKHDGESIRLGIDTKQVKVDTVEFTKAILGVKSLAEEINSVKINAPSMLPAIKKDIDNLEEVEQRFKDAFAIFNDGSTIHGLDDIMRKISEGFSIIAADLGERVQYLKDQISGTVKELKTIGAVNIGWDNNIWGFANDDMSESQLKDRISLLQEVLEWQKELETFSGKKFSSKNAPSGRTTNSLGYDIKSLKGDFAELEDYNSRLEAQYQITTKQLKRRQELISQANAMYWFSDQQNDTIRNIKDDDVYETSIQNIKGYISEKELLIEQLRSSESELFRDGGVEQYINTINSHINDYKNYIQELQDVRFGWDSKTPSENGIDFSEVVQQLELIKDAINEVRDAFKPLTDALANENNAFSAMVKANIADLEALNNKVTEAFNNIEKLSKKEFKVVDGEPDTKGSKSKVQQLKQDAKAVFEEVQELYNEAIITSNKLGEDASGQMTFFGSDDTLSGLDMTDFAKRIKSRSAKALGTVIDELNEWKKVLLQFNSLRNNVESGSFNVSKYSDTSSKVKVGSKTTDKDDQSLVEKDAVNDEGILNKVKSLAEAIKAEFDAIRVKIDKVFNFSTINPNIENINTITEEIYKRFEELQVKIGNLEFKLQAPKIVDTQKSESDVIEDASDAMEDEGEAAGGAVPKKNAFTEANERAADSAKETKESAEGAAEGIKTEAKAAEQASHAYDKISTTYDEDRNPLYATQKKSRVGKESVDTTTERYIYEEDENGFGKWQLSTETIVQDYKAYERLEKDAKKKVAKAQAMLQKFMSQFENKTAGKWTDNDENGNYNVLNGILTSGIGSVDEIDNVINKMQLLDAEYNNVVKSFRKGTKSMNPFVNAFNSMDEMKEKVAQIQLDFANLKFPTDILSRDVGSLPGLLDALNEALKPEDGVIDIVKIADAYGNLNAEIKKVNAAISTQRKDDANKTSALKQQESIYENAIKAQEKLYNLKKQMIGLDPESSKGQETMRKLTEAQNEYNEALSQTNRQLLTIGQIQHIEDLEAQQKSELSTKRKEYKSSISAEQEAKDLEYVLSLYKKYAEAEKSLKKMQSDTSGASHDAAIATATENSRKSKEDLLAIGIDINNISESELLTEKQKNALLEAQLDLAKQIKNIEDNTQDKAATKQNKQNQNYGKTIFNREKRYSESISGYISSFKDVDFSSDFLDQIEKYKNAYKELEDLRSKFENDPNAANNKDLKTQFQESALKVEELRKSLIGAFKEYQKFSDIDSDQLLGEDTININKIDDAKIAMMEFADKVTDGKFKFEGFNAAGTEMYGVIDKGNGVLEKVTVQLSEVTSEMKAFTSGAKQVTTSWSKLGSEFQSGIKQIVGMYFGFHEALQAFRNGVKYVKEIDLAMTELRKVTDETDEAYNRFLKNASITSSVIGSTISDFTDATAAFARLGYTIDESSSMAETAIVYKNVADGLDTVEEATDSIISTMMAFGINANDTMSIIDKFNAVGNSFAITSAGIGDALQRSASALYSAGNTIDESVALVTAANSVIQNPEQVGTALKTLALRLRGAKTELEEAGLETDNMAESTSTLQAKLNALTHGKVDIMLDPDTFKSTTQILREMSGAWEDMTDIERAAALELMGGKRQANILSSVIQNFETVEKVIETSMDSTGSAMAENEKWLDSIEGKTYQFTNALETMWSNLLNPEVIKGFIDFGTGAIQFFDSAPGKITAVVAALAGLAKFKGIGVLNLGKEGVASLQNYQQALYKMQALQSINLDSGNWNVAAVNAYAAAVDGLTAKKQAEMLATAGLNKVQITEVLQRNQVSGSVIDETLNKMNLMNTTSTLQTVTVQEAIATQLSADAMKEKAVADFIATNGTKTLNVELIQQMVNQKVLTAEQGAAIVQTYSLAGANTTLAGTFKTLGLAIKDMFLSNPLGFLMMTIPILITIGGLIKDLIPTTEDHIQEWEDVKDKIKSINQELETTRNRINELEAKGVLSFADKKELELLRQQNDELERRLRLEKVAEEESGNKARESIKKDYEKDFVKQAIRTDKDAQSYNDAYGITEAINQYMQGYSLGNLPDWQSELLKTQASEIYNYMATTSWTELDSVAVQAVNDAYNKFSSELQNLDHIGNTDAYVSGETYIDQAIQKIQEYKDEIYDANGQLKDGLDDKYVVDITTNIDELESDLAEVASELYTYLDNYDGDDSDPFVQNLKAQLEKIDMTINPVEFYNKKFDEIFDTYSEEKRVLYELAEQGKLTADVLNDSTYAPLMSEMRMLGVTADNVAEHIKALSDEELAKVTNPEFNITDYTESITAHSASISEFQEAIQKLDKGSFTMDDFMDLIKKYPDLAKGVDISSKSFYGLSRNLNKAIKTRTKGFVDDLQRLKESLVAAGKETDSIDQLIEAVNNMPDDALDDTIEKYGTLADKIDEAKTAQDKLLASMEENPNDGYENRGEAIDYMKEAMKKGEIGSESNLWNVAEEYGFTYDSAKSINENADALAKFIAVREKWFKQDDDGDSRTNDGYSYEGTENFMNSVEKAAQSKEFRDALARHGLGDIAFKWNYDDSTGTLDFDFDNADWDMIISALSQTEELAGLTSEEFADLLVQVGQYFDINWSDANDVSDYISKIASGSGDAADKIEQMTDSVETYVEKALGTDLDFSSLTDASVDALSCDDSIKQLLKTYLSLKESLEDPLNIEATIGSTESVVPLLQIEEIKDSITQGAYGFNFVNTDTFTEALQAAGYTEEKIQSLIDKIKEYQGVISTTNNDPLGLNSQNKSIGSVISALNTLGVEYQTVRGELGQPSTINIKATDLVTTLKEKDWSIENISAYLQTLSANAESLGITIDGKVTMNQEEIDDAIAKSNEIPEEENVTINVNDTEFTDFETRVDAQDGRQIDTYVNVHETTTKTTKTQHMRYNPLTGTYEYFADGTAHAQGTAFAGGSWGAPKTETALVGELGPELLVRNGRWTTVGDNGAEFTQVKKGDIIFNHKQTQDLLSKGYVTGRAKAYANGTAFASGSGTFNRYEFSGSGGYTKYDVNNKAVDKFGDATSKSAKSLSNAADKISDAADKFEEVFDWIEVRLEEIDETLGLLEATLENAIYYTEKNSIIDSMIDVNNKKLENLKAGYDEYAEYASKLLAEVPEKYRDAAQDGAIAIEEFVGEADEATLEAINNYREWAQKAADLKQQTQEVITTIRDLAIQKFDNAYEAGDVRATVEDSQTEKLQNAVDYDEERGLITSDAYYIAMMENSNKKIEYLTNAREAMQKELNAAVEAGQIERGSNEWYELLDQMYQIDAQIDEATIELEEFQNAINDLYWDNFDQLINRLEYLKNDTQSLIDLMSHDDLIADPTKKTYEGGSVEYWTADDVKWTDEGLASIGLYAQQMEIAEYTARQYAEAIDDLEKDYKAGLYSENEYVEKLEELKDAQYENIEAYYDAQDAIIELNKTRVDSIKDGIEKELDAYEELIEKKKEALDAEKDLYDFQKSTAEQQKNIAQIERQLAALANDTSLSAAAKRKQLEQELATAQYELQDTYYNRSVEDKQTALDKELEAFQAEKDAEILKLEEYLTNVEQVVADSLNIVQANADAIGSTLTSKAEEYNLTVSDAIMTPWQDGSLAVSDYQDTFDTAMSSTMNQLEALKNKWQEVIDKMTEAGKVNVDNINKENANYAAATKKEPEVSKPATPAPAPTQPQPQEKQITVGGKINAKGAKIYTNSSGGGGSKQYFASDPIYTVLQEKNGYLLVRHHKVKSGATGWFKKSDVKAYAKGTTNLKNSGIVNIDELGEELVLRAQNGRLTYMEKGSGVVPADLTSNLMEWGKLDPTSMLEQNRPSMNVHPEIHNTEVNLSVTYGDILHIEEFKGDNPEDIAKIVAKQFEKHTKDLNNALRKFVR